MEVSAVRVSEHFGERPELGDRAAHHGQSVRRAEHGRPARTADQAQPASATTHRQVSSRTRRSHGALLLQTPIHGPAAKLSESATADALRRGASADTDARRSLYLLTLWENSIDAAQEQRLRGVLLESVGERPIQTGHCHQGTHSVANVQSSTWSNPAAFVALVASETPASEKLALCGHELPARLQPLRQAAASGNAVAQLKLARHFQKNYQKPEHDKMAIALYLEAIQNGSVDALYELGKFSDYKTHGARPPERAVHYYERAAALNHPDAQFLMGMLHLGLFDGTYIVSSRMPNYYERNLNNDYSSDAFCMRSTAIGEVKRDVARGTEYLRRAAAQKHGIASRMLLRYTPQDGTVATFLKKLLAVLQA